MTIAQHYGLNVHPDIPLGSKEFYCGVEFEIESIKAIGDKVKTAFHCEQDHSLRNHGMEFKSPPTTRENQLKRFKMLHSGITLGVEPFSERTSTHVHVNVANLEFPVLREIVLTYALLEPLFFSFVGETRKSSIFCVPLNYTYLPGTYKMPIEKLVTKWQKYTAFNLLPICPGPDSPGLGTIEFRHLYGTDDIEVFNTWLKTLEQLYNHVTKTKDYSILELIEAGTPVHVIAKQVIPELAVLHNPKDIDTLCEDTLLDVMLAAGGLAK